jgi:ABC-type branched-subunit amino acid transport system substrate-binding protein
MLLPLGGFSQTAAIAKSMKQAGEMALFELDNPAIQLIAKDDKGTTEGARAAAREAINEGAEIILGPLFADAVAGAASVARAANVPMIAFSNDRKVAGNGVYLLSYLPEAEVERIVSYAAGRGKRRFAALVPSGTYGSAIETAFRAAVTRSGGTVVALEHYEPGANQMLGPAQRVFDIIKQSAMMGASVDALFLPGGQETLPSLGPQIAYAGIDTSQLQIIGTGAWEFPNIGRDPVFVGGWYPNPDPRGWRAFSERFARNFGQAPPRLASLAYDAMSLSITLSSGDGPNRYSQAAITRPAGFNGVDGVVRFTPDGLSSRGLAVLEVQKFGSTVIDPAPGSAVAANSITTGGVSEPAPKSPWAIPSGATY